MSAKSDWGKAAVGKYADAAIFSDFHHQQGIIAVHDPVCVYRIGDRHYWEVMLNLGRVAYTHQYHQDYFGFHGWGWDHSPSSEQERYLRLRYEMSDHHLLGFAYQAVVEPAGVGYRSSVGCVFIPLWFPTLLSTLLLWLVWRKTRPRTVGFPVEPSNNSGTSK